jgi:putative transposase
VSEQTTRIPYPSDLSNKEWELIKPHFPIHNTNLGRKRVHSYREY